jgi:hypothetical protein
LFSKCTRLLVCSVVNVYIIGWPFYFEKKYPEFTTNLRAQNQQKNHQNFLNPTSISGKKEESSTSDWWSGAYLKGPTLPKDLQQRGTFGGPQNKKKKKKILRKNRPKVSKALFVKINTSFFSRKVAQSGHPATAALTITHTYAYVGMWA